MNDDQLVPIDYRATMGARDLIRASYDAAKELNEVLKDDGVDPIAAGMLAYGALFTACCAELNVPVATGLYVVQQLMSRREPSSAIH